LAAQALDREQSIADCCPRLRTGKRAPFGWAVERGKVFAWGLRRTSPFFVTHSHGLASGFDVTATSSAPPCTFVVKSLPLIAAAAVTP